MSSLSVWRSRLHYRWSLASRVGLLATVAVGLAVALVALAGYVVFRHEMFQALDRSLYRRATAAAQSPALAELKIPSSLLGAADVQIAFLEADGQLTTVDTTTPDRVVRLGDEELTVARGDDRWSCRTIGTESGSYRVAAVPYEDNTALVLAQSLEPTTNTLDRLQLVLLIFGGAGVVAAGLAGWGVARSGLRPVRRLTQAAEDIARTEKLDPIPVSAEGNDEIARLTRAFNVMLAALAASRDRQRQLVADAGHELRTPLTSLRTNLELLTQAESRGGLSPQSRQEVMADVQFQIEELTTLIGDLTELARDEPIASFVEPVDLAEVVERALDRVRRRASGLTFDIHAEPWWVTGESSSLERAVTNLLDNAVKWSPPGGRVTVRLANGSLFVADDGPGIAAEDLPFVFDRFYRSAESRTLSGSGLGLSIVRRVAERHGGTATVGTAPGGGAALWFEVPGSADRPPEASAEADPHEGLRSATPQEINSRL